MSAYATQFLLGSYIHACTNETDSLANLQDVFPTLADIIIGNTTWIKSCRFARECVSLVRIHGCTTQMELCLHEQTQIRVNAACIVGSQQFL